MVLINLQLSESTSKAEEITRLKDEINKLRDVLGILNKSPQKQQELLDSIKGKDPSCPVI